MFKIIIFLVVFLTVAESMIPLQELIKALFEEQGTGNYLKEKFYIENFELHKNILIFTRVSGIVR